MKKKWKKQCIRAGASLVLAGVLSGSLAWEAYAVPMSYTLNYRENASTSPFQVVNDQVEIDLVNHLSSPVIQLPNLVWAGGQYYRLRPSQSQLDPPVGTFTYNSGGNSESSTFQIGVPAGFVPAPTTYDVMYVQVTPGELYNYTIEYVDEGGHKLIHDDTGSVPDMTWMRISPHFIADQYDNEEYVVRQTQSIPPSQFRYNSNDNIQVLLGANYPNYTVVCVKIPSGS